MAVAIGVASLVMLLAAFGVGRRRSLSVETSEVVVVVCAAALALLLAVVCIGSLARRGQLPFGGIGALVIAAFSVASPVVVWMRHDGALTSPTTLAVVLNAVCLVMLALAYALARRRVRQANRGTPRARRDE